MRPRSEDADPGAGGDLLQQAHADLLEQAIHLGRGGNLPVAQRQVHLDDEGALAFAQDLVKQLVGGLLGLLQGGNEGGSHGSQGWRDGLGRCARHGERKWPKYLVGLVGA